MVMILITGGSGYVGSHVIKLLNNNGYETINIDNLERGHERFNKWGEFIQADIGDYDKLKEIFSNYPIEGVMHFAAYAYVDESIKYPDLYFKNNYENTLNLLKVMREENVKNFIFSSTCSIFGDSGCDLINENTPVNPINPYAESKLLVEKALKKEAKLYDLKYVSLRYFNAAGDDPDCEIGEDHNPETRIIPLTLAAASGIRKDITIFGSDYPTPDGTCVRDYVHVNDIAQAHIKAFEYLLDGGESDSFNIGNGKGFSVKEVIQTCKKVTGRDFPVIMGDKRPGDPAILVADSTKIREKLNWNPKFDNLEDIVETAWNWHKKLHSIK